MSLKNNQRLIKIHQSDEISAKLVTIYHLSISLFILEYLFDYSSMLLQQMMPFLSIYPTSPFYFANILMLPNFCI